MKKERYRLVILLIACIAMFSPNYAQYQLSPLAPCLMTDLGISNTEFASIFSAPMIPAIFLSLGAGILVDRFGAKKVLGIAMLISSGGLGLRLMANSYTSLFVSMVLVGFSALFLNASGPKILGAWYPPSQIGVSLGVFFAVSTMAMAIGMGTTAMLPSVQSAYWLSFIIGLLALSLWLFFMKSPEQLDDNLHQTPSQPIRHSLKVVLNSGPVWIVGLCLMLIMGGNLIISSFLPTALGQRGIDPVTAGAISSAFMLGSLAGCLLTPALASKFRKLKLLLFILGLIAAIFETFAWQAPIGSVLWLTLFLTGLTLGGMIPLLVSLPIRLPAIGPQYAGMAGGLTATLQLLGAVILPTRLIVPLAGDSMSFIFLGGGICLFLAGVVALFLPDFHNRQSLLVRS